MYLVLSILILSTIASCNSEKTKGLEFELNEDKTEYTVVGYSGKSHDIIIPNYYKKKPVTTIGKNAFRSWYVTSIYIPANVQTIEEKVFYLSSLQAIQFDEDSQLKYIGEGAFDGSYILDLKLPDSLTHIGNNAFTRNIFVELTLPPNLISIGDGAFGLCKNLVSINLPESIEEIGIGAFSNCYNLKSIHIPKKVEVLNGTFYGCIGIEEITFDQDSNLKLIRGYIWGNGPNFRNIILPNSLEEIGIHGLAISKTVETITFLSTTPPLLDSIERRRNYDDVIFYVPKESVEAYKVEWEEHAHLIQPIDD